MIASALPPRMDGIGDHTAGLAAILAEHADVVIHTSRGFLPGPIPGVTISQSFQTDPRHAITDLDAAIRRSPADWLILQYNPFCFGNRGFNPFLAGVLRKIRRDAPAMKLAVMVHEMYMPVGTVKNTIMSIVQRRQFAAITALAEVALFSTGPWAERYHQRFPNRTCVHMPVGSNVPLVPIDRDRIRLKLGIPANTIVLGSFGGDHPSRLFGHLAAAGRRLKAIGHDVRILSIGSAGPAIHVAMPDLSHIDLGSLSATEVSTHLQAIDIYASPFFDGVSTRRGSFFAGIQHGLATVTTRSYHSDAGLMSHEGTAFLVPNSGDVDGFVRAVEMLAADKNLRRRMGTAAKMCFDENYSSLVLAQRWLTMMGITVDVPNARSRSLVNVLE